LICLVVFIHSCALLLRNNFHGCFLRCAPLPSLSFLRYQQEIATMTVPRSRPRITGGATLALVLALLRPAASELVPTRYSFAEGLWETTVNVTDRAAISRDIRDMHDASDLDEVMNIYENGRNSVRRNSESSTRMLQFLAKPRNMEGEFTYTVVRHDTKDIDFINARIYAISKNDDLGDSRARMVAETIVASTVWMYVSHLLYESIEICDFKAATEDGTADETEDGGAHTLDEAAAYYIGLDQGVGDADSGYSLYNLAEQGREIFGTSKDGMARVNREIITMLKTAKDAVGYSNGCQDQEAPVTLRYKADLILTQMKIPLIQMLIHNMYKYVQHGNKKIDAYMTSVYAKTLVPHIAACSPQVAIMLKNNLYAATNNESFMSLGFNRILARLQSTYECLNISCEDVGVYKGGLLAQCTDPTTTGPDFDMIAGYQPTSYVRPHLLIDVDILQMGILMEEGAYDEAEHIYKNGRNSHVPNDKTKFVRTLQDFALSSDLEKAPFFEKYTDYYLGSKDYADIEIRKALNGAFSNMTHEQRKIVAINSTVYLVVFMYIQRHVWIAHDLCEEAVNNNEDGTISEKERNKILHNWDQAVAFFVGSLEGSTDGGSPEYFNGLLQFNLNRQMCRKFGDCVENTNFHSKTNDLMIDAFNTGKKQVLDGPYCKNLKNNIISRIEPLLMAGLFQGLLSTSYDITNIEAGMNGIIDNPEMAENYIFALSVIPIINEFYPAGTETIKDNSINISDSTPPMNDGYGKIFEVVASTYANTQAHVVRLKCEDVGMFIKKDDTTQGICPVAPAPNAQLSNSESSGKSTLSISAATILLLLFQPLVLNL